MISKQFYIADSYPFDKCHSTGRYGTARYDDSIHRGAKQKETLGRSSLEELRKEASYKGTQSRRGGHREAGYVAKSLGARHSKNNRVLISMADSARNMGMNRYGTAR